MFMPILSLGSSLIEALRRLLCKDADVDKLQISDNAQRTWQRYESPFADELARLNPSMRQHVRFIIRCCALRTVYPGGDKDSFYMRGTTLLEEMIRLGAPLCDEMRKGFSVVIDLCDRVQPWQGGADNTEHDADIKLIARLTGALLADYQRRPDMPVTNEHVDDTHSGELAGNIQLAMQSFEPEFQQLLLRGLAHLPHLLPAARS